MPIKTEKIKRPSKTVQLSIRIEPKIHEALIEVGERIGVKPAVLAGLAIGDYVTRSQATYSAAHKTQEMISKEMSVSFVEYVQSIAPDEKKFKELMRSI